MKKLVSADIFNFQAHRKLHVDFSNYTGITGPTNKGKSAIIRAINWCLYNSPSGDSFTTRDAEGNKVGKTEVRLNFDDGTQITRIKGGGKNSYDIVVPGAEPMHLEGFGVGPVDEVIKAHGMYEIDFFGDKQSLNICKQLSQPFFLGESATTKAVMIGKLGKTDIVDLSIKNVSSEIRNKKADIKEYKDELKEVKAELSELKGLNMMERAIEYADKRCEKIEYIDSKIKNIKTITSRIVDLEEKSRKLQEFTSSQDSISEAMELIENAIEINSRLTSIKKIVSAIDISMAKLESLNRQANIASTDEIDKVIDMIDEIIAKSQNITTIKSKVLKMKDFEKQKEMLEKLPSVREVEDAISDIDRGMAILETLSKINQVNKKYKENLARKEKGEGVISKLKFQQDELTSTYKKALIDGKKCPICMSEMTEDRLDNIEEYM